MSHYFTKKQVILSSLGVICEWYDFCLYMYLGHILSFNFLSHFSLQNSQFDYYLIFAIGYLVRPFGGIFFGRYADKYGRKPALLLSIKMLVIVGVLISLLPTYHQIGLLAPICLLLLRGCQGFAMGGEFTAILTLMFENSEQTKQGFALALMETSSVIGMLLSAAGFFAISHLFSFQWVLHIGWRLCFILGSLLLISIYYIQNHLPESFQYQESSKGAVLSTKQYFSQFIQYYKLELTTSFMLMVALSLSYAYVMVFLVNNYLRAHTALHHLSWIVMAGIVMQYPANYLGGYLNDRFGSIKALFITIIILMSGFYPCMYALGVDTTGLAYLLLVLLIILPTIPTLIFMNQIFPIHIRCLAVFVTYNLANAIFCGLTPSISLWILDKTHHLATINGLLISSQVLALVAVVLCQMKRQRSYELLTPLMRQTELS